MSRELTRQEKAAIRSLVKRWCANYDKDIGCLPLDCECYMLGKCWTGAYCRYFRSAVLPLDPVLERSLTVETVAADVPAVVTTNRSANSMRTLLVAGRNASNIQLIHNLSKKRGSFITDHASFIVYLQPENHSQSQIQR